MANPIFSEAGEAALLAETRKVVGRIRKARIHWLDENYQEIVETLIEPCLPGETIKAKVPHPDDVTMRLRKVKRKKM